MLAMATKFDSVSHRYGNLCEKGISRMKGFTALTAMLLLAMSIIWPPQLQASELIREFSGSGNTTTAEFSVESPWILDWRLDSDFETRAALATTSRIAATACVCSI
jgi:hypothetical protein